MFAVPPRRRETLNDELTDSGLRIRECIVFAVALRLCENFLTLYSKKHHHKVLNSISAGFSQTVVYCSGYFLPGTFPWVQKG
jgi:hypothetical protein